MNKFQTIVNAIKSYNNCVIDDRSGDGVIYTLKGVAQVSNSSFIVGLLDAAYFQLNLIYLDKHGRPRISKEGAIGALKNFGGNLHDSIRKHNARSKLPITDVVLF